VCGWRSYTSHVVTPAVLGVTPAVLGVTPAFLGITPVFIAFVTLS
jgi:hypothetical protein